MSSTTDLQAAVATLTSDVTALATVVNQTVVPLLQQLMAGNTVSATDAENAVTAINQAFANIATETSDLTTASTPPAPPPTSAPSSP